jgi:voltage-gated potassium channel
MNERLAGLKHHYILGGAGHTGFHIAAELRQSQTPFVIIEQNPAVIDQIKAKLGPDLICLEGNATEDETLIQAGVEHAKDFIAALSDDKDNIFAVLTARALNPHLRIMARVDDEENVEKLRKAGADVIIAPNQVGGMRMAAEMIRPEVVAFLDQMSRASEETKKLRLTEIYVADLHLLPQVSDQLCIADVGRHNNLLVIAIKRDGQYIYKPRGDITLHTRTESHEGDSLIVIGTQEELDRAIGGPAGR